jgi:hypothetical protein
MRGDREFPFFALRYSGNEAYIFSKPLEGDILGQQPWLASRYKLFEVKCMDFSEIYTLRKPAQPLRKSGRVSPV